MDQDGKFSVEQARKLKSLSQLSVAISMNISKNAYISKEKYKRKFYVDEAFTFAKIVGLPLERIKWNE